MTPMKREAAILGTLPFFAILLAWWLLPQV